MRDYLEFLEKLWNQWATLLTGGTAIALLGFWERSRGAAIPPVIFWVLAILLLVRASFIVWRNERSKRAELEERLRVRSQSRLESRIDWVYLAREPGAPNDSEIIVVASITNRGAPTSADGWLLTVQFPDGSVREAKLRPIPEDCVLLMPGESREFKAEDALYDKAIRSPIPTGGKIRGILRFQVEGVNADLINQVGNIFGLWFKDSFGDSHPAFCTISSSGNSLPAVFPGIGN